MRRPYAQTSQGLAAYERKQRDRQERDERENRFQTRNPEALIRHAVTRVIATESALAEAPDLGAPVAGWQIRLETHQGVEPIALETSRQLVVGESGVYDITFDIAVIFDAPSDPDDLLELHATISAPDLSLVADQSVHCDPMGEGAVLEASVSDTWALRMGTEILASFEADVLRAPPASFSYAASMVARWRAPLDVPAPILSS